MTLKKSAILFLLSSVFTSFASEFYVSSTGDDSNPGTIDKPFRTFETARDAVRKANESRLSDVNEIIVYVRAGYYYLKKSFELSMADSGRKDCQIIYRPYKDETVIISGGLSFDCSFFKHVSDPNLKKRIIASTARDKVVEVDLVKAGVDFNKIGRMKRFGFAYGLSMNEAAPTEVFFENKPMKVARWPNEGFVKVAEVIREGSNPRIHNRDVNSDGKVTGPTYITGIFRYEGDRPKYWIQAREVWFHGFWAYDWADDCLPAAYIDTKKCEITLGAVHEYGLKPILGGGRYYALNMLEEIDVPGEYYIDPYIGVLYFYPPEKKEDGKWGISLVTNPLVKMKDVSYVKIENLTFEMCRDLALMIEGGEANLIAGCTIRNTGGWAINVLGGTNHTIQSCEIYNVGRGGIKLVGGDQATLTSAGHRAVNNHIYDFSRRVRTYQFGLALNGVGITAANNLIHGAPHCAVDYRGNFITIELNEFYNLGLESDDSGAINSDRDYSNRGNVVRYNYFHDIVDIRPDQLWLGNHMIYYDSCTSGQKIIGNIFRNGGRVAININGGRDMIVKNNIFMDLKHPVEVNPTGMGPHRPVMIAAYEIMMNKIDPNSEIWRSNFPNLVKYTNDWDELGIPRGNVIADNLLVRTKNIHITQHPKVPIDVVTVKNNVMTDKSPFEENNMLKFKENYELFKQLPELRDIPLGKIGLYKDDYRKQLP